MMELSNEIAPDVHVECTSKYFYPYRNMYIVYNELTQSKFP